MELNHPPSHNYLLADQAHTAVLLEKLNHCLHSALKTTPFDAACLFLPDSTGQHLILSAYQTAVDTFPQDLDLNLNLQTFPPETCLIEDLGAQADFIPFAQLGFQSALHTAIFEVERPTQKIGSLLLLQHGDIAPSEDIRELVKLYSTQLALILDRHHMVRAVITANQQVEALEAVNAALGSNMDMETLLHILLEQITQVLEADVATIALIRNGQTFILKAIGDEALLTDTDFRKSVLVDHTPVLEKAIAQKHLYLISNTLENDDWVWLPGKLYIRSWIGIPIFADEQLEALITLHHTVPSFYQPEHLTQLEAFQNQAGLIIRTTRLFAKNQKQTHNLTILNRLARELATTITINEIGQKVTDCLHDDFHYLCARLYLPTAAHQITERISLSGTFPEVFQQHIISDSHPVIQQVIESGVMVELLYDAAAEITQSQQEAAVRQLAIPVQSNEILAAVLMVEHSLTDHNTETSLTMLGTICDQLGIALQKAHFFEETMRHVDELQTLFTLSSKLRAAQTKAEILPFVIRQCTQICYATGGSIMLLEPETGDLVLEACYPEQSRQLGVRYKEEDGGIVHHVAQTRKYYVAPDVPNDLLTHMPASDRPSIITAQSSLSIPLQSDDQLIGVLNVWFDTPHMFSGGEINLLNALAEIAAGAIDRVSVHETLEQRVQERTQALEEANQQLKELDALKSRFISEVSHELRTPIANLSLYVSLFKRNKDRPEKQEKYLDVLNKQVGRLENLIENVLYLSRLDLGQDRFEFVPLDVNAVIEEVLIAQTDHADSKGLMLTYEAKRYAAPVQSWMGISRTLKVLGDRNQLAQLITHLVDNAIKYTHEGAVNVYLYLDKNNMACIEVVDSGTGIPVHEWDNIFKRFYRGELTSQLNIPGNGLGLAIAEEVAKLHNGRIDLESKVDEGSKFFVWLPIIPF